MNRRFSYPNSPAVPMNERETSCRNKLAAAIDSGEMGLRATICPCGANEDETVSKVDRIGLPLTNVICRACGLIRANPYIAPDSIGEFYARYYETLYHGDLHTLDEEFAGGIAYTNAVVLPLLKAAERVPTGKRVLMIGGRSAGMLQPFAARGNDCMVVDYNEDAIANARARGIAGMAGDYKKVQFDGKFDLILLDNVLEHFLDMPSEVAALRALLNEGGGIFVAVPDAHRLDTSFNFADARKEFMLCHSFLFSRETVTEHMRAHGFHARVWDHKPFPHSLLVYFEKGDMAPPAFSKEAYNRQQAAFARAEQKYRLYRLFLIPWFWRTVVPVLKRSGFITGLYRRLRGVKSAMPA